MSKFQCKKFGIFNKFSCEGYYYFFQLKSCCFFFSRGGDYCQMAMQCYKYKGIKLGVTFMSYIGAQLWLCGVHCLFLEKKHSKAVQNVYHKYSIRERYVCVIPLNTVCVSVCAPTLVNVQITCVLKHVCLQACARMCA